MLFPSPITLPLSQAAVSYSSRNHSLFWSDKPPKQNLGCLLWSFCLGFVVVNLFVDVVTIVIMAWEGRITCLLWSTNQKQKTACRSLFSTSTM